MDIGESISIAMEKAMQCPIEHEEPVKIESQPAPKVKCSKRLGQHLDKGKSTCLFGLDDDGSVVDKGLQAVAGKDPKPDLGTVTIRGHDLELPVSVDAHHIIPGKDSLPKSKLKKYVWKSAKIYGDIGYHVDGAENGVWLPSKSILSAAMGKKGDLEMPSNDTPGTSTKKAYRTVAAAAKKIESQNEHVAGLPRAFAQRSMERFNAQFHQNDAAHRDYSEKVVQKLGDIATWLDTAAGDNCEDCKKAKAQGGKMPPPHILVFRLNSLSRWIKGFLVGPPSQWRSPWFVSIYAKELKASEELIAAARSGGG